MALPYTSDLAVYNEREGSLKTNSDFSSRCVGHRLGYFVALRDAFGWARALRLEGLLARAEPLPPWVATAPSVVEPGAPEQSYPAASITAADLAALDACGLLDRQWYTARHPDLAGGDVDLLVHFHFCGWQENRCPNAYFQPDFYLSQLPEGERAAAGNPVLHYYRTGERRGLRPAAYFDPVWYRSTHEVPEFENALVHYLAQSESGEVSPLPEFDVAFYLEQNPDVRAAGVDPFLHFLESGFGEGRCPSPSFDLAFYRRRYLNGSTTINPLLHFLAHRSDPDIVTQRPSNEMSWAREHKAFTAKGRGFEEFAPVTTRHAPRAKVFAYYLTQFHSFPENDAWWGRGFTEWTNIARGAPRFEGHYQPRIPRDLGFYDLTHPDTIRKQVALAQAAGIFGFCYYFYWFNGKRLMERPLDAFLADTSLSFPFVLMWANENWTRRWDGFDDDILIRQDYAEDDDPALIGTFLRHFSDPRYYRIDGRPLLMIYRPGIIPDARAKFGRWRSLFASLGNENPIIVMAQGFGDIDPGKFGLDGAVEFPPHKLVNRVANINADLALLDADYAGHVFSFTDVVETSVSEPAPSFPLIRTAFPSWDNDARRPGSGMAVHGSTPELYQEWLEQLISRAAHSPFYGERIVCINAWNEWAEGAYLEPDVHFGAAYLNATSRAIAGVSQAGRSKIVLIGHDAHPHGAQLLLQNIARVFTHRFGLEVEIVLLDGGKLVGSYKQIAKTTVARNATELRETFARLFRRGFRQAIANSVASARAVEFASEAGLRVAMLVHELPSLLKEKQLVPVAEAAIAFIERLIFPAEFVRARFLELFDVDQARTSIRPQGCYQHIAYSPDDRSAIRGQFGIGANEPLVLGVGFADLRKGFDLFLAAWRAAARRASRTHFMWVGRIDENIETYLGGEIQTARNSGRLHLVPFTTTISAYFAAADMFFLSSREDPFPTVALEALQSGIPIVAFADTGGIPELVRQHGLGEVVALADAEAVVDAIGRLHEPGLDVIRATGNRLSIFAQQNFLFPDYAHALLGLVTTPVLKISVFVPNYNYARHLLERIDSILSQKYPIFEFVVLDDRSTDDSLAVLQSIKAESGRDFEVVVNAENSGSVSRQWRKAVEQARGDYIWIAEADDASDPEFLLRLANAIESHAGVALAFSDSAAMDEGGALLSESYKFYYNQVSPGAFEQDGVWSGPEFVRQHLGERNLILNVSACLWRRDALLDAFEAVGDALYGYQVAGDWRLYVAALSQPDARVAFVADPLNRHRRHQSSVTHSLRAEKHLQEIFLVHRTVRSLCPDDSGFRERQDAYLTTIARQFDLPLDAVAHLEDHVQEPQNIS